MIQLKRLRNDFFSRSIEKSKCFIERLDLVLFCITCIRSAVPVFFDELPNYMRMKLERAQKRAFSIICPNIPYIQALQEANIPTIVDYCEHVCHKTFDSIVNEKKLLKLLPTLNNISCD